MSEIKQQLYEACLNHLNDRIVSFENSIKEVQQSANEETKSSAGDKYETARAMAQLEIERFQVQLAEVLKMKEALARIPVEAHLETIKQGSLIFTTRGNFYIAINAGQLTIGSQTFFSVSAIAPIAQKLIGLGVNDAFNLNNQDFTILNIQ